MALIGIDQFDPSIYEQHGREIGRCTATLLVTANKFVTFMKTQRLTSHQMNLAASAMYKGLCAVGRSSNSSSGHIKNLCSLVWSVLKRRNFELLCLNHTENLKRNRDTDGPKKTALRSCIDQLQISDSDACKLCGDDGLLVVCENCKFGWHFECAPPNGLLDTYLKTVKNWFCHDCVQSGSEITFYKKPRIQSSAGNCYNQEGSSSSFADSASVVAIPEPSVTAASAFSTNFRATENASVDCNALVPAVVSVSSTISFPLANAIGDATSSESAPVTSAPVLRTAAAKLSEKMSILSMKLMQVPQPSEQAYQNYFSDIERFLLRISQQLDADSACMPNAGDSMTKDGQLQSTCINVIGEMPAVDDADSARVSTGSQVLPNFCKESMPRDVQSQSIIIEEFGDCLADKNVGTCKVFRVYTTLATDGSHPYDTIALEFDNERFYANSISTSGNQKHNTVTITEPGKKSNCLTFSRVSSEFLSWALARMPKNHQQAHFNFFEENSMARVDCGSGGNCFFHSCLFLLKLEVPDFTFKMENRRSHQQEETVNLSQANHAMLRQATCQYLRQHFAEIRFSTGIAIVDAIKVQAQWCQDLSDKDIIERYCEHHEKLGVWVENPIVVAFAHFCQISLSIFHVSHAGPYPLSSPQPVHSLAQGTGLFCDETHYQASSTHTHTHTHNYLYYIYIDSYVHVACIC